MRTDSPDCILSEFESLSNIFSERKNLLNLDITYENKQVAVYMSPHDSNIIRKHIGSDCFVSQVNNSHKIKSLINAIKLRGRWK